MSTPHTEGFGLDEIEYLIRKIDSAPSANGTEIMLKVRVLSKLAQIAARSVPQESK